MSTITTVNNGDSGLTARTSINNNFSNLNTDKLESGDNISVLTNDSGYTTPSSTDTLTNKTIDADGTGNVITNIGSSEIKSEIITGQSTVTAASGDYVLITDASDSNALKKVDANDFLGGGGGLSWGDSITDTSGTGITIDVGANSSANTKAMEIGINNTQSNKIFGLEIDTGTFTNSAGIAPVGINIIAINSDRNFKTGGIQVNNDHSTVRQMLQDGFGFVTGRNHNTNSSRRYFGFYGFNENNTGSGANSSIFVRNESSSFSASQFFYGLGAGIVVVQTTANGCALSISGVNNINASTYGLVSLHIEDTQSGATVMQKIDTGTSTQEHLALQITGTKAAIEIGNQTAPSTTTNKLYAVSGNLFWNGTQLN